MSLDDVIVTVHHTTRRVLIRRYVIRALIIAAFLAYALLAPSIFDLLEDWI